MLTSSSTSMLWRGAFAVIVGIVTIVWPGITIGAVVLLFAVYAFSDAVGRFGRAFGGGSTGSVLGNVLLALLDVTAGVVAIAWPGITAYALAICLAVWALVTGSVEIAAAFAAPSHTRVRTGLALAGVSSVVFGIVTVAHPGAGILSLALLFGLFTLVHGVNLLVAGSRRKHAEDTRAASRRPVGAAA